MVRSGERTDVIETSGNRMFREIARIMMNSLTGKCLSDTSDFEVRISTDAGRWIAELTPRRREMEQFFSRVRLHFDPDRQLVTRVEMIEKNGDRTVIDLKNLKTDAADIVEYCRNKILDQNCHINRQGKNWYCEIDNVKITINSYSFTIITAHRMNEKT